MSVRGDDGYSSLEMNEEEIRRLQKKRSEEQGIGRKRTDVDFENMILEAENKNRRMLPSHVPEEVQKEGTPQPSTKKRLEISKTSDPDYYAETLLYEIRRTHNSIIDCYRALEKHLNEIDTRIAKKRKVRKET